MGREASTGVHQTFAQALRHHQAGHLNEAEQLYRRILAVDPDHADALHFLGVIAHQSGHNDAAVELIAKAIARNGTQPAFHNNLGNALKALGRAQDAIASYERALVRKPDYAAAHFNLGVVLQSQDKLDQAIASYRSALNHRPNHADTHGNLGNVLQAQGKLAEAVASYQRALMHRPDSAEVHGNLGNVLKVQGKLNEAIASYERALRLKPDYAEAHGNLGLVFFEQGRLTEASACYEQALRYRPDYTEAHTHLGHARREQGKPDDAIASYRRALSFESNHAEARLGAAMAVIPVLAGTIDESIGAGARFSESLDELTAWNDANPGKLAKSAGSSQPFYLAYRPADVTALLARYGDTLCAAAGAPWPTGDDGLIPLPRRGRIRLVVVSGQVRRHPVWDVILRGIIAHIDRGRFEVFLYHTGAAIDEQTHWAKSRVDQFIQGPQPTQAWLRRFAQERPDVIFYPEVGMDSAAAALAALRLAPLQVAGWGHPVTTGLPTIDVFLSGELLEGPGAARHYRETLVRLPGTGVCTEAPAVEPQTWNGPERPLDTVRFALCQQPIKFDPADDVLLARIAAASGPCEFWLATPRKLDWATARLMDRLSESFRMQGLDPGAYLRVTPWLAQNEFLGFLEEMDVYLDCPAFSGYTTAWQAIHRGLPIVTIEGEFLRQRLGAGLLRQVGITEGIAKSRDEYVDIAVRWAGESRRRGVGRARRDALREAASAADGNRAAVAAFERTLIDRTEDWSRTEA